MTAAAIVLVHSPFVGPSVWTRLADVPRENGSTVIVPSLKSELELESPSYSVIARSVACAVRDLEEIELIVHSGAGSLAEAIVEACSARVGAVIFVDAVLPHPGRSWMSTLPKPLREHLIGLAREGRLPTWDKWFPAGVIEGLIADEEIRAAIVAEMPRVPLIFANEIAPAQSDRWPRRCAYLRLSAGYEDEARKAEGYGWPTDRADLHHLAILSDPKRVAVSLRKLLESASTGGGSGQDFSADPDDEIPF